MLATQIKTASDLKAFVESAGHESHFFSRSTMRFFGDTMRNYGVRRATIETYTATFADRHKVECFELYRRHPVKRGMCASAYFCPQTFRRIFPIK